MFFLEIRDSKACGAELWADIEGYEGLYQISTEGRVRSLGNDKTRKTKVLKANKNRGGYLIVRLWKGGTQKWFQVHRLVADAFLYCKDRDSLQVNHKNEVKTDNKVENLEYCDQKYNSNYGTAITRMLANRTGIRALKPVKQMTLDGKIIKTWSSTAEAGRNGFCQQSVAACCAGKPKYKTHKGFKWCYA